MATGSSNVTSFDAILINMYLDGVKDIFNDETTLYGWLTHKPTHGGRNMIGTVRTGRTFSHGAQVAGGTLPTPQTIALSNVTVPTKYMYGTLKITNEILKQANGQPGSAARALATQIDGLTKDMRDNVNRMLFGNGSGTLGQISTGAGSGNLTWTLTNASDVKRFGVGQLLHVWSNETPTAAWRDNGQTNRVFTVASVDPGAGTIAVDDNTGGDPAVNGDVITYSGARTGVSGGVRYEPMGLDGAIDDANPPLDTSGLFGINRTSVVPWRSYVNTAASNRPITEGLLQALMDGARISGGGAIDAIFSPFGVRAEYGVLQQNTRRTINTTSFKGEKGGGFQDYLEYNGVPIIPDKHCRANTLFGVNRDALWLEFWGDWDWMADDGNILTKVQSPGIEPAYYAVLYTYFEMFVHAPSTCSKLEAITGTDPAAGF